MIPETQGKTINSMNNQAETTQKSQRIKTGALSVTTRITPSATSLNQSPVRTELHALAILIEEAGI